MVQLLPSHSKSNQLQDAIGLLQWLIANPGQRLMVRANTVTESLVEAGVLTPEGFFDPNLRGLLPILEKPHLAHFIPEHSGGRLLHLLGELEGSDDGQKLKDILCAAVSLSHEARDQADSSRLNPGKIAHEPYAVKLADHLREHCLDSEFLSRRFNHALSKPERITFKIERDLATQNVMNNLPSDSTCVARWSFYQALMNDPHYKPTDTDLDKAGIARDSLPALRAHCNRGGLHLVPCHLILHIGQRVLRVAVFSIKNSQNSLVFEAIRSHLAQTPCPAEVQMGMGKTFQLDASIGAPGDRSTIELFDEIKKLWQTLRDYLFGMEQAPAKRTSPKRRPSWLPTPSHPPPPPKVWRFHFG